MTLRELAKEGEQEKSLRKNRKEKMMKYQILSEVNLIHQILIEHLLCARYVLLGNEDRAVKNIPS